MTEIIVQDNVRFRGKDARRIDVVSAVGAVQTKVPVKDTEAWAEAQAEAARVALQSELDGIRSEAEAEIEQLRREAAAEIAERRADFEREIAERRAAVESTPAPETPGEVAPADTAVDVAAKSDGDADRNEEETTKVVEPEVTKVVEPEVTKPRGPRTPVTK